MLRARSLVPRVTAFAPTLAALGMLGFASIATAATPRCRPRPTGSRFVFQSHPWVNLHNFLVKEGKRVRGIDDDALGGRGYTDDDTAAARPLSPDEQRRWNALVQHYADVEIANSLNIDSLVINVDERLARADPSGDLPDVGLHPGLREVLVEAMPLYRAHWWSVHDLRNRRWIGDMQTLLAQLEECMAAQEAAVLHHEWPSDPIRVDATVYASWAGAFSTQRPTHVVVASNARGSQDFYGLEVLIHEVGHGMMARVDSVLAAEAVRQGKQLPKWLSHLVLFHTAGTLVREQQPSHTPYAAAFGVWNQNGRARDAHAVLERVWQPYLEGRRDFGSAITALIDWLPAN